MPSISKRGLSMPQSPIRKLVPFAEKAKAKGRKVYHLNIGQPDIETPEIGLNAVKENYLKVIEYSHSAGIESYRKKLAEYYQTNNIPVDKNELIITCGGSEAIMFGFMSCLNPGDEVIIPEPFYANYNGFAITADVAIKPITSSIENGYALPPIAEFEKLITEKTKAIAICNPNNPTGYLYSKEEIEALRDIVIKHDLYLFADEVYREFCYENHTHTSVLHYPELYDRAVIFDSVSKRYSACGVRIGALVTKNKDVLSTAMKYAQARLSPPTYGQILSEAAVDTPQSYFDAVIEEYLKRRDIVVNALNNIDGVTCPTPKGAFYAAAKLPIDDCDRFCQWLLEDFEYNNQTVMLAPLSGFYSTSGLGKQEVRIGYVLNEQDLTQAMLCIKEALKIYPGKTN